MSFRRVVWIVLDSVGIGAMPDASDYGDSGSDTLGNLAPLVAMFAGAEGVKAVLRTIDEATRWFP